jgi:diguanylate cyclase (GGDEF)-like protein/PAS domain S-box-containing protein
MSAKTVLASMPGGRFWLGGSLLLALTAVLVVHVLNPTGVLGDATFLSVGWMAAGAAWVGARRAQGGARLVPFLIAAGLTASAGGDLSYRVYQWNGTTPDISLADIPWFSSFLGLGAALFITLVRAHGPKRIDVDAVIDVLTVVAVSVLVFWNVSIAAIMSDDTVPSVVRVIWAGYPVADAVLFALVLRALAGRRSRAQVGFTFALGVVCWLGADLGFLLLTVSGVFSAWLDVGWLLGAVLMAQAAWRRPVVATVETVEAERADTGSGLGRVAIAIVPLMVPPVLVLLDHLRDRRGDPLEAVIGMAVLLTLAFARTARLVKSERRAKADARKSHRHYARLAANSSDAVAVLDLDGRLMNDSPQLAALLGFEGSTKGMDASRLLAAVDPDEMRALFARVTATAGEVLDTEVQIHHHHGYQLWLGARMVNMLHDPDVEGVILAVHDISDRKRVERDLSHQAFHDALTELPNRALFRDRVEHALRRTTRSGLDVATLYLDLDGFKNVNDSLGHDAGDDLLRQVAARLVDAVRSVDTVARLGGDEFAVLIEASATPLPEAITVAERILQALSMPFQISGSRISLSASVGIAASDSDSSADTLVRNADIAMYRAKSNGKAQWVAYDPLMRAAAMERLQLENDLEKALAGEEFRLMYQPLVRLETKEIVGFEALLRWDHPTLGLIMPDRFIPIAEDSGSIVPIGLWVLRTACQVGARWQCDYPRLPPLTMAVNLSARQLATPDLVQQVAQALTDTGLDPTTLVLEMTETALIHDATLASRRLHELRALGIRLAIDDFGTGYSSLSYLRQFPVDILKIDRSFINTITDREKIPAIVRGLLDLGRTLQLETVAEGVEDDIQRDSLRDENCELAQGYLFARPLDPIDADTLLAQMTGLRSAEVPH